MKFWTIVKVSKDSYLDRDYNVIRSKSRVRAPVPITPRSYFLVRCSTEITLVNSQSLMNC